MSDPKKIITNFIIDNFLFGDLDGLKDDSSFLEEGIIDSTGVLELVSFMEAEFKIKIADEELVPSNLDSINNITLYLGNKMQAN